jgi:hypothetical protein
MSREKFTFDGNKVIHNGYEVNIHGASLIQSDIHNSFSSAVYRAKYVGQDRTIDIPEAQYHEIQENLREIQRWNAPNPAQTPEEIKQADAAVEQAKQEKITLKNKTEQQQEQRKTEKLDKLKKKARIGYFGTDTVNKAKAVRKDPSAAVILLPFTPLIALGYGLKAAGELCGSDENKNLKAGRDGIKAVSMLASPLSVPGVLVAQGCNSLWKFSKSAAQSTSEAPHSSKESTSSKHTDRVSKESDVRILTK